MQEETAMMANRLHSSSQAGEERYRHLFEHAPICIVVIDLTTVPLSILEVNRRAQLIYGYAPGELIGMSAADLMAEDARSTVARVAQQVRHGQVVTVESMHRHRDGTRFPVRMTGAADPTDDDHMIVTVEEITAERQRRSEAEAITQERLRIAHEIHDGLAQNLAGLRLKLALWSHLAEEGPPEMHAAVDELQQVLNDAIIDLRRAIFALRPLDLDEMGFFPALSRWVADFGDYTDLSVQLVVCGHQHALPSAYELPLFRILQESLNNTSQHANASSAHISLIVNDDGSVAATVRDNGRGFDANQLDPTDQAGHFGLRQMRERVLSLGGTLDICSQIGQGTELSITLPPRPEGVNHASNSSANC